VRIGILGGGQLGRMLALAAPPLGLTVSCLERTADCPAAAVAPVTVGDPADPAVLADFASSVDVLTYEIEGLPEDTLAAVAEHTPLRPPLASLHLASDRWDEKQLFLGLGIPVPRTARVDAAEAITEALEWWGGCVVKTRRGGYDGRGQAVVRTPDDLPAAVALLAAPGGCVAEELVAFTAEVSVLGARGLDGAVATWPLARNTHVDGILRRSRTPAGVPGDLEVLAASYLRRLLDHLDHVGVLALELFVVAGRDGPHLLANEIAPRVHNTGHHTPEACETGQFEQHLRAVAGLPLGSTALRGPTAMVNLLGELPDAAAVLAIAGTHLHLYGKAPRPGRKLGHVTVTAAGEAALDERLAALSRVVP